MCSTETKDARTLEVGRLVSSTAEELPGDRRPRGSGEDAAFCSNIARRLRTPELMSVVERIVVSGTSERVDELGGEVKWQLNAVETSL